jgi:3'(2'), 5'-bisphosphate nucleotidase
VSWALVDELEELAVAAGELILQVYSTSFAVEYKSPGDPVTRADAEANALIVSHLKRRFPHAAVVAEESEPGTFSNFRELQEVFFVDPLDGTREFVARNGEFVVMIGYVRADRAQVGVIHSPVFGATWSGCLGLGARCTLRGTASRSIGVSQSIGPQPINVSAEGTLTRARALCSRSHGSPALYRLFSDLGVSDFQPLGSAGLKGVRVAEGAADLYLSLGPSGKYWDSCALDAIVHAAGGKVTDARGEPIDYRAAGLSLDSGLVVANSALHAQVIARIARSSVLAESPE